MTVLEVDEDNIGGLDDLAVEADAEGHSFVRRTIREWTDGTGRFDDRGELLLACFENKHCIAVRGICLDPYTDDPGIGRLRHVYVATEARRRGVGRMLVSRLLEHAWEYFPKVRVYTDNPAAAALYEKSGFHPTDEPKCSHAIVFTPEYQGD